MANHRERPASRDTALRISYRTPITRERAMESSPQLMGTEWPVLALSLPDLAGGWWSGKDSFLACDDFRIWLFPSTGRSWTAWPPAAGSGW